MSGQEEKEEEEEEEQLARHCAVPRTFVYLFVCVLSFRLGAAADDPLSGTPNSSPACCLDKTAKPSTLSVTGSALFIVYTFCCWLPANCLI